MPKPELITLVSLEKRVIELEDKKLRVIVRTPSKGIRTRRMKQVLRRR